MTFDDDARQADHPDVEAAPLLPRQIQPTPLPVAQLLILAAVRLSEPISYTQIFPYVNEMMERLHVTDDPASIGFYSGLVDSSFALAQLLTIYQWGALSDRIGRKPVLLMGLSGVAFSALCFGLSQNLATALLSRSLAGMLSGNVVVVSSMISEMTDSTNQGKAFPLLGATWSIGCVLGPIIGGGLSDPAVRYPMTFGKYPLLREYPYFLPCAISSTLTIAAIIACMLFVDETLPSKVAARKAKALAKASSEPPVSYGATTTKNLPSPPLSPIKSHNPSPPMSVWNMLALPSVRAILFSSFMLSLLGMGFEVVFVLYSYTRIELGGLGRSPVQIGYALAASGLIGTVTSLFVFPALQRRFNNRKMYALFMSMWPIGYLFMPLGNYVMRLDPTPAAAWVTIAVILTPIRIAVLNFPLNMILAKASAPSAEMLGAMFGLQQTLAAAARAFSPAFVSSLFAVSIDKHLLGGNLVWIVMILFGVLGVQISSRVVEIPTAREQEQNDLKKSSAR